MVAADKLIFRVWNIWMVMIYLMPLLQRLGGKFVAMMGRTPTKLRVSHLETLCVLQALSLGQFVLSSENPQTR